MKVLSRRSFSARTLGGRAVPQGSGRAPGGSPRLPTERTWERWGSDAGKDCVPTQVCPSGRQNRVQELGWVGWEHRREALWTTKVLHRGAEPWVWGSGEILPKAQGAQRVSSERHLA